MGSHKLLFMDSKSNLPKRCELAHFFESSREGLSAAFIGTSNKHSCPQATALPREEILCLCFPQNFLIRAWELVPV